MKRGFFVIVVILFFGFVGIVTTSCKKAAGGGWLEAPYSSSWGKATFGFNMICENVEGEAVVTGQFQYNDHYNRIKFHAVGDTAIEPPGLTCEELDQESEPYDFIVYGYYTPQPKGQYGENETGLFLLAVTDGGEPGFSEGDEIGLALEGGAFNGYENIGPLLGGNIQVFEE